MEETEGEGIPGSDLLVVETTDDTTTLSAHFVRLAEKARRTGEPVAMSPMSAVDRKVVHTALGQLGDVTTLANAEIVAEIAEMAQGSTED